MSESKIAEKEAKIAKLRKQKAAVSDDDDSEQEEKSPPKIKKASKKPESKKKPKATDEESSDDDANEILEKMRLKISKLNAESSDEEEEDIPKPKPKKKPSKKTSDDSDSDEPVKPKKSKKTKKTKKSKKAVSSSSESDSDPEPEPEPAPEPVKPENEKLKELLQKKEQLLAALASKSTSTTANSGTVARMQLELDELRKKLAVSASRASQVKSEYDDELKELQKREYGLDICFLMDCTGSMGSWLAQAKNHCRTIMQEAIKINDKVIPRISFVGYRDFCDGEERLSIVDFKSMNEAEVLRTHLDNCPAKGGGDAPEDVAGGLDAVLKLGWIASTRLVIHLGDAPCHGSDYHKLKDDYPKGDPNGLKPEELLGKMCNKKIDYYFCKITNHTDVMMAKFEHVYTTHKRMFQVHNLGENPDKFLPTSIKSITESMSRSAALSKH